MQYYMHIGGQQLGPFEENQLIANGLTPETPVWAAGMAGWLPANQVPELGTLLYQQQQQQPPQYAQPSQPMPETYMVWAILATLWCCLPFGIVAIVKAAEVSSRYNAGNYSGAVESSQAAKKWCIWAAVCGIFITLVYAIVIVACGLSEGVIGM